MVPIICTYQISKRHTIGISLLIHLLLLLWLLYSVKTQSIKITSLKKIEKDTSTRAKDNFIWASTSARNNVPVTFMNMPPAPSTSSQPSQNASAGKQDKLTVHKNKVGQSEPSSEPDTQTTQKKEEPAQKEHIPQSIITETQSSAVLVQAACNTLTRQIHSGQPSNTSESKKSAQNVAEPNAPQPADAQSAMAWHKEQPVEAQSARQVGQPQAKERIESEKAPVASLGQEEIEEEPEEYYVPERISE